MKIGSKKIFDTIHDVVCNDTLVNVIKRLTMQSNFRFDKHFNNHQPNIDSNNTPVAIKKQITNLIDSSDKMSCMFLATYQTWPRSK